MILIGCNIFRHECTASMNHYKNLSPCLLVYTSLVNASQSQITELGTTASLSPPISDARCRQSSLVAMAAAVRRACPPEVCIMRAVLSNDAAIQICERRSSLVARTVAQASPLLKNCTLIAPLQ